MASLKEQFEMTDTDWNPQIFPVVENIRNVMIGKDNVIRLVLVSLLASGHCLLEDVPGVGKTMMVRATARSLGCDWKRLQFTPDMLPSDVTGVSIYQQHASDFQFRPGPIFAQIVLADEINRTSPKTQSALLEALEEKHVTVDGISHSLPSPFFVLATENPIDFEGTFPLPEAQLDRFLMKIRMGYPSFDDEMKILSVQRLGHPIDHLQPVATPDAIMQWRKRVEEITVHDQVQAYLVRLVQATRSHRLIELGASPRASLALYKAAQAYAFIANRQFVIPDDIRQLAPFVLAHRLLLSADARFSEVGVEQVLQEIIDSVSVPMIEEIELVKSGAK